MNIKVAATVIAISARMGCVGQIIELMPKNHAPVPIALATSDAFRVTFQDAFISCFPL